MDGQRECNLETIELKAFVPAKDFEHSKQFYADLGFQIPWSSEELAYLHFGNCTFLLQNFYVKELAENFMMHLSVQNVDDWWEHVREQQIAEKYGVNVSKPEERPWGMRDFVLIDPSGVLWRIAENTD
ncbi:VOC family protein [Gimesia panareensis]|uniref:Glyoxalase-like domain protein n=1 Tax=Gimesia panareensis TaxID=2527978 RepID=A0A517Q581_9PLAN|nr:VOC family protein [Gimesia panareensis]QDT26781.1 Glyoxalase-like domain protein [Gimesia panareensis]QDU50325.1 Glyoxalase-like domain protein [Gimesia panareensis]